MGLLAAAGTARASGTIVWERFDTPWTPWLGPNSYGQPTDGLFKTDGDYCVPYGKLHTDELETANVSFLRDASGVTINLTVPPGTHVSSHCGGVIAFGAAEIASDAGWEPSPGAAPFGASTFGYGYYETLMRPSCVQGESASFFWIQAPHYGPLELDVEFPNPPGHSFTDVHWTIHPSERATDYELGFNPCAAFHRYGFLWTPGQVTFTVDGQAKRSFTDATLRSNATGFVMANATTGNPNWGGGPPNAPAVNSYRWIAYGRDAASVPSW